MSGFIKRFVLSMVASKLERAAHKRGRSSAVDGLLREVNHQINRRAYGHPGGYGHHGHYRRHHGHYRQHHGHYRRRRGFW